MNKDKFYTCIDYGASKIRLGAFETENSKNLFISEKNSISNFSLDSFDLNDSKYKLNELIKEAEKGGFKVWEKAHELAVKIWPQKEKVEKTRYHTSFNASSTTTRPFKVLDIGT